MTEDEIDPGLGDPMAQKDIGDLSAAPQPSDMGQTESSETDSVEQPRSKEEFIQDIRAILMKQGSGFVNARYKEDPNLKAPFPIAYIHHGWLSVRLGVNDYCVAQVDDSKRELVFEELSIPEESFWIPESV